MVNYGLVIFIYFPVLLLALIAVFKDKFELANKALKSCNWTLLPVIVVLFFFLSSEIIRSLWYVNVIPILEKYPYNPSNWVVFSFFYYWLGIILIYVLLRYIYKVSIIEVFNLKLSQIPFILKVCSVLAVINIMSIYLLDLELFLNPRSVKEIINSMDTKHIILFSFMAIVFGPIVEESIFRGLIYGPLFRKVGRRFAIILTSLIWTYVHFEALYPSIEPFIIGLFISGIVLTWLYDRSGSLIHPIIFHMFKNSWILLYIVGG